jgi:Zn-dependent M28 family amino/carboxypeptidase
LGALIALLAFGLVNCARDDLSEPLSGITTETLEAHTYFLAGDLMEGRGAGSAGGELAASYIASQFEGVGLEPAGDSGYLQPVPMVSILSDVSLSFRASGGAAYVAGAGSEFIAWSSEPVEERRVVGDLVFVGYGISAPTDGWDDYRDNDVAGRVLLLLAGEPPGRFRGDTLTYAGLLRHKLEEAAQRGAVGVLVIHTEDARYGWDLLLSSHREALLWPAPDSSDSAALGFEGWLAPGTARQVVAMAGLDFETLLESARSETFRPVRLELAVSAQVSNRVEPAVSHNVIGTLPGSDPELADEFVVFLAHYDHLGIGPAVGTDSIYNGCYDNASGVAALLAVAEAFSRMPLTPPRSILFLAVTGKEAGFLGSRHYVANPLVPLEKTVAAINIDGANLWGLTADVVALGAVESGLGRSAIAAARAENLRLEPDQMPERGSFGDSDSFSFLRRGVPVVFVQHGLDYVGRMPGWGREMLEGYYERDYHRPSDECEPGIDFAGAVQQARVAFRLGLGAAKAAERPRMGRDSVIR